MKDVFASINAILKSFYIFNLIVQEPTRKVFTPYLKKDLIIDLKHC